MEVSYLQNNDPNIVLERANYHKAEAKTYHIYAVAVLVAFVAISTLAIAVVAFMAAESMLLSVMFLTLSFKVVHSLYRPLILVHYAHKTAFATEMAVCEMVRKGASHAEARLNVCQDVIFSLYNREPSTLEDAYQTEQAYLQLRIIQLYCQAVLLGRTDRVFERIPEAPTLPCYKRMLHLRFSDGDFPVMGGVGREFLLQKIHERATFESILDLPLPVPA